VPIEPIASQRNQASLTGRVALVTGGGSGIGAASARALAAHGSAVAVTDLDADSAARVSKEIIDGGGQAIALRLDVTDETAWPLVVAETTTELGPITVLHGNAGPTAGSIMSRDLDVVQMEVEIWDLVMAVVLKGNMLGCKNVIPSMIEVGGGSIILTSSIKGRTGSSLRTAYASAKGGLEQFSRVVATGYGRFGIRCNAIAPGIVETPGLRETVGQAYMDSLLAAHLLPRLGRDDDIAAAVVYLASDASSFMTAQTLVVDGGLSSYVPVMSPPVAREEKN
jgi:NAD(P)-dependent dehydrogenase (short-subunit alcohol dehydrogenase family)